ncbi:MAG: YdiY family protein [Syntrophomonadaceae bacterium]
MKLHLRLIVIAFLWAPFAALAQTPECPCPCPCPAPPPPPPVWFGKADLSFLSTSGNTDTTSIGGSLELNYNPKPWLFTLKGAALHAATDGVTTAETFTASLKASRDLTEHIDVFVGGGWLRNRFSGINNIYNFDGGAGYKILNSETQFLRLEGGVGYSTEQDIVLGLIAPYRNYANVRAGLGYKWQITKTASFTNDYSFLQDLSDSANWFMTDKAAIAVSISKVFALQASWTLLYRNEPPVRDPGPPPVRYDHTDTATAVGLVAKF